MDPSFCISTFLVNNSGSKIEIQQYYGGKFYRKEIIENKKRAEYIIVREKLILTPFVNMDSVRIIYETASIWHTRDKNSLVTKNIMLDSSYVGGQNIYTYTFTKADYEEAIEFGD
jgi:hypothetical protein